MMNQQKVPQQATALKKIIFIIIVVLVSSLIASAAFLVVIRLVELGVSNPLFFLPAVFPVIVMLAMAFTAYCGVLAWKRVPPMAGASWSWRVYWGLLMDHMLLAIVLAIYILLIALAATLVGASIHLVIWWIDGVHALVRLLEPYIGPVAANAVKQVLLYGTPSYLVGVLLLWFHNRRRPRRHRRYR